MQHDLYVESHELFLQQMQEYEEMAWEDHRSVVVQLLTSKEEEWQNRFESFRAEQEERAHDAISRVPFFSLSLSSLLRAE